VKLGFQVMVYSAPMPKTKDRDGIYKRPDRPGFWASWTDASGKRRRRLLNAHTVTQARTLLAAERVRVDKIRTLGYTPPGRQTFAEVKDLFLKHQKSRITPKEYTRQKGVLEKHCMPFFGQSKMADIRRATIQSYITKRAGDVAAGTVVKELNTIKRLFHLAVEWEIVPINPVQGIKPPGVPAGRVRYLEPKELTKLLKACPEYLRPIVGLGVSTGMRRGEIMSIRWANVDVARARILLTVTKNGEPRYAYLNGLSLQVIESLATANHKTTDKLFPGITPAQVTVAFVRACKTAEIDDFSFHDLRHTAASWLRMKGADIHTVAQLLGHEDLRMAARYSHLSADFLGDAVRKLDDIFPSNLMLTTGE